MVSAAQQKPSDKQVGHGTNKNSIPLGGSNYDLQFSQNLCILNDASLDTAQRRQAFDWLIKEYGDHLGSDIPLEKAIRTVANESSEMGRLLRPLRNGLDCRDTLIKVGPLLGEQLKAATIVLSPTCDANSRLAALEQLVTHSQTRTSEEQTALCRRGLGLIVETINREALSFPCTLNASSQNALPEAHSQGLYSRAFNLQILFNGTRPE
jgi:hypothetical protein